MSHQGKVPVKLYVVSKGWTNRWKVMMMMKTIRTHAGSLDNTSKR